MSDYLDKIINFFKNAPRPVVLHEPCFRGQEASYVQECIETGWVSSVGSYVDQFERDLSDYLGAYAVPVVNGTAALHLSLILAGIKPGDHVLVPDLTFVATANAVSYCHATPHFVEVAQENFAVDPVKLDRYLQKLSTKPKALIVTHIFGHPAPIEELRVVCDRYGLILLEDAAESLGSYIGGKHTGTFGQISALSFNGNKIITTGGGGAVITTNKDLVQRAKHLSTTAKVNNPYNHAHDALGYNYRMPNINAALGCAQLEQLPNLIKKKRRLANRYRALFKGESDIIYVDEPANTTSNFWLNNVILNSENDRNQLLDSLNKEQIFCRGLWAPMTSLPMYSSCPAMDTSVAYDLCARTLSLPSSPGLVKYIDKVNR